MLREPRPPRGLILSTGEDIPRGHSVRARLLILELSKGAITTNKLTECQREAEAGLYAKAMGAFIQWTAGRYDEIRAGIVQRVADLRTRTASNAAHARTPEIIAELQAGFEVYLDFAEQCHAIQPVEREQLADQCWNALGEAATTQAKHQSATEPTARFLNLLRGCLASGEAHLATRSGIQPERSPESCGWRLDSYQRWLPLGSCIGWVENEDIYLEPSVAYRVAQAAAREIGEALSVSEQTLRKRLREKGLLVATDEKRQTLTVRRSIAGSGKDVLFFHRATLLPDEPDKSDNSATHLNEAVGREEMSGICVG
jgi:hypothetical protein